MKSEKQDRSERAVLTVLCLLEDGGRILLQDRVKEDWHGVTLPGGHVEPGESFVGAAVREMQEETGLTVLGPRLCGVKQFQTDGGARYVVLLFRAARFTGELRSSPEGRMFWARRGELTGLPLVADFEELLSVCERADLSEFQYGPEGDVRLY